MVCVVISKDEYDVLVIHFIRVVNIVNQIYILMNDDYHSYRSLFIYLLHKFSALVLSPPLYWSFERHMHCQLTHLLLIFSQDPECVFATQSVTTNQAPFARIIHCGASAADGQNDSTPREL